MKMTLAISSIAFAVALSTTVFAQGGGFGGGGRGQQGQQGQFGAGGAGFAGANAMQGGKGRGNLREMQDSVQEIDREISAYLDGGEIKSILTPGEFCEWPLKLKSGQVVIAEARSDAFDPALEIVGEKKRTLAANDDRYLGDQRPLLFWRCEKDGLYNLHLRCFHDKSGGEAFVRFRVYDSVDLSSGKEVEQEVETKAPFLLRIPMKAGEIKQVLSRSGTAKDYMALRGGVTIAPGGLPDINLAKVIQPLTSNSLIIAPVAGDYYLMETGYAGQRQKGSVDVWTQDLTPDKLALQSEGASMKAPTQALSLGELSVKAGEFLEVNTPDLSPYCQLILAEAPDVSKYDISKQETNPFVPQPNQTPRGDDLPIETLASRAGDNRTTVFYVRRDAKLWIASNGAGSRSSVYTLEVKPAAKVFAQDKPNGGKLRIADTDYWTFDGKVGDVMMINSTASGFTQEIVVRDPELNQIRHSETGLDETAQSWKMTVQKPGRYLVAMSCPGNGGGGDYSLVRTVFHAKDFGLSNPAKDEIGPGEVQVWKFTTTPSDPVLIRWASSNWTYEVNIYDDKGQPADFQRELCDAHSRFGLIKVDRTQTYIIVLTGSGARANYSIELNPVLALKAGTN